MKLVEVSEMPKEGKFVANGVFVTSSDEAIPCSGMYESGELGVKEFDPEEDGWCRCTENGNGDPYFYNWQDLKFFVVE